MMTSPISRHTVSTSERWMFVVRLNAWMPECLDVQAIIITSVSDPANQRLFFSFLCHHLDWVLPRKDHLLWTLIGWRCERARCIGFDRSAI